MSQLEEVVRPLKAEASTIRLWLARVANHLDRVEPSSKDRVDDKLADLFGPCSPIHLSPSTPPLFALLAAACTPSCESQQCSDKFGGIMDCELPTIKVTASESIAAHNLSVQSPEFQSTARDVVMSPRVCERMDGTFGLLDEATVLATSPSICTQHMEAPESSNDTTTEVSFPRHDNTMVVQELQVGTDVVVVEVSSDDEEDPVMMAIDGCTSSVEAMTEETQPIVELLLEVEPPPKDTVHHLSPVTPTTTPATRHRRKSYDKSLLRRSTRLAKCNILRNLGIIGNDGKLDEDAIKGYAECLKQLLPPDVLSSLVHAKGRAFWDLVAGISLPLR
jgi:hypothetical protein